MRMTYCETTGSASVGTSPRRMSPTSKEVPPTSVQMTFASPYSAAEVLAAEDAARRARSRA